MEQHIATPVVEVNYIVDNTEKIPVSNCKKNKKENAETIFKHISNAEKGSFTSIRLKVRF